MVAELEPEDPRKVGPYLLLGRLGSGGMGWVYLGRSRGGRHVAVKVIRAELAGQADFRTRFAREVAAARTVSGVFTAPVVDADLDAPMPWLATAYVPGPSLSDAVARHGPLPVRSVIALAAGLAEGLEAIHAAGIVHRDLKPSNVLLAEDGPRVIDFGISRAAEESPLTGTGLVIGSPGFMSPEQAQGHAVGPPSDVFSLAAVLTFAATGQGPFGSGSSATLLYRVVSTPPALDDVPPALRPLIERCLAKDPQQRPSSDQLLSDLNAHPVPGWLPTPITQGFSANLPSGPAIASPVAESGPPTVTAAPARTADVPTGQQPPASLAPRSGHGGRRRGAWVLITTALLAVAAAAAVALTGALGAHRHQAAAVTGTYTTPSAVPSPATTAATTQQAAPAGSLPTRTPGSPVSFSASPSVRSPASLAPIVPTGVFWTAAVLSAHYVQDAQRMVQRLDQNGYDGEYWRSTSDNSVLPGYWVVTSGHFPDQADAVALANQLKSAGFAGAYARCIGPRTACPLQGQDGLTLPRRPNVAAEKL
jgi:eukaryotic-like serine/threonine-protein kinase